MNETSTVFIGLGTNLEDREKNLEEALEEIRKFIEIEKLSSIYETQPVDYEDQDWFLNMVIQGETKLSPRQLLSKLQKTENKMGRTPTVRKGPRIIDLDILFYSNKILAFDDLTIPHPEIQNRSFALTPLNEIAPGFIHPKLQKDIQTLFTNLNQDREVRKWTKTK